MYRITTVSDLLTMRDMEDDYGIIPMPKYNEQQENYISTFTAWVGNAYVVPIVATNPERTSIILEYMASVSTDTVRAAHYDVLLQGKIARDQDSSDMLDIIFNSITTDLMVAFNYGSIRTKVFVPIMDAASDIIASTLAEQSTSINKTVGLVNEAVSGLQ